MRVLAALFRIFSLLGLLALCGLLWLKFDTQTKQQTAFLDDVLDDAYGILQSDSKQWDEIKNKKGDFIDVFDTNEQVPDGSDNPLEKAVQELNDAEQNIFRGQAYRELLDETTKEYGPGSLYWDAEANAWRVSDGYKLESPANYKDPFEDLSQFPFKDEKQEDGSVIKGVPRHQRLRTVIGMFYKDRHNLYSEFSNLRSLIVERDVELRRYQNMWAREKEEKETTQDELSDAQIKLQGFEQDIQRLEGEKKVAADEAEAKEKALSGQVEELNARVNQLGKDHEEELDKLSEDHKRAIEAKQKEIAKADADGYQRGIEEMLAKQQGGEVADDKMSEEVNPFMVKKKDSGPPAMNELDLMAVSQQKQISEIGAPSTISRVDSDSGMMLLPFGMERGVEQGTVFTVWKDKREAARIRVQSSRDGFLLAYILPRFGEPQKLRPGDSIYIIPEKEQEL